MTDQPSIHQPGPYTTTLPSGLVVATGRPAVRTDRRTLRLNRYLVESQLPPLADVVDNTQRATWLLGHNDRLGDCVQVARANGVELVAALSGVSVALTDDDPVNAYSQLCGYRPGDPSTDGGCMELDTLNAWHNGANIGGVGLEAFVGVTPQDGEFRTIRYAIQLFGFCFIGVDMPRAWQAQTGPQGSWDAGPAGDPAFEPGSWGGHAIILVKFDWTGPRKRFGAITWKMPQEITREAMLGYCDERYALFTTLWRQHVPESGINADLLTSDLLEIRG